jgi:UDP-glucose 4-epimerase
MGMKWLITGGCGFLGTSLIANLLAEGGHAVRIIDNLAVGSREDLAEVADFHESAPTELGAFPQPGQVELVVGDIQDAELALPVARGADVIVHFAANTGVGPSVADPRADCMNNVVGIFNYLEAARVEGVPRFVFASSNAPIGEVEPPVDEEATPRPLSPYGASKLAGEAYCSAYHATFGVETVVLRFGNVYGPRSKHKSSVVAQFIRRALNGESLEIYGSGDQTRDFLYVADLLEAVKRAATVAGVGGEVFQIATSAETTVNDLAERLRPVLEASGVSNVEVRHGEARIGDIPRNYSDTSKADRLLGWQAGESLDTGLRKTVDWFLGR